MPFLFDSDDPPSIVVVARYLCGIEEFNRLITNTVVPPHYREPRQTPDSNAARKALANCSRNRDINPPGCALAFLTWSRSTPTAQALLDVALVTRIHFQLAADRLVECRTVGAAPCAKSRVPWHSIQRTVDVVFNQYLIIFNFIAN